MNRSLWQRVGLVRYVQEGEASHWGYGRGWFDSFRWRTISFPLGINVLMRLGYALWISVLRAWPRRCLWLERLRYEIGSEERRHAKAKTVGTIQRLERDCAMFKAQRDAAVDLAVRVQSLSPGPPIVIRRDDAGQPVHDVSS